MHLDFELTVGLSNLLVKSAQLVLCLDFEFFGLKSEFFVPRAKDLRAFDPAAPIPAHFLAPQFVESIDECWLAVY
jgi:hypothetical protein